MTSLEMVREFHRVFGQEIRSTAHLADEQLNELRYNLLNEELEEFWAGLVARDPVAVLDALTDLQYVLDGAYLALGFHRYKDAALAIVHASNMSKLGEDGRPVYRDDGKVMKGPNFRAPDLSKLFDLSDVERAP